MTSQVKGSLKIKCTVIWPLSSLSSVFVLNNILTILLTIQSVSKQTFLSNHIFTCSVVTHY